MANIETPDLRVILIEGNSQDSELMTKVLHASEPYKTAVAHVGSLNDAIASLENGKWDAVLLNINLPDSKGLPTLEKVKSVVKNIPILIVNALDDDSLALKCVRAGAQTYLTRTQVGTKGLNREIQLAIARQGADTRHHPVQTELPKSAVVVTEIEKPFMAIRGKIGEVKQVVLDPFFDRNRAVNLLSEAEEMSKDLQVIISELKDVNEKKQAEADKALTTILVVDDEQEITEMLIRRLNRLGYEKVDTASNGIEAYNKCIEKLQRGEKYSAIISDWNMPKLTGIELLRKIRENFYFKDVPFMMLTAVDEVRLIKESIALKVSQYLVKPFKPDEFDRKVGEMVSHRPVADSAVPTR